MTVQYIYIFVATSEVVKQTRILTVDGWWSTSTKYLLQKAIAVLKLYCLCDFCPNCCFTL